MSEHNNFQLTRNGRKIYSKSQQMLFSFVPKDGTRITSFELADMKRKADNWRIDFPRNAVISTMGHLMRNITANQERFRIRKSRPKGPYPSQFWFERL